MAPRSQVPKFGNWENGEDVPYTAYFEKAKKGRNPKTNTQIPDPSSNNEEPSFQAREEVDVRYGESTKSEPEIPKDQNSSGTNHETRVSREEVDLIKSTGSPTQPKRTSRQSVGSDQSFDSSPMHPHQQARVGNKSSVSSEGSHSAASSTPGRSRLRQITRGDENAREEADVRNGESTKSETQRPKDQNSSRTNHETRVSREEVDLIKSTGSSTHPKRTSRQSVGSDRSFDSSPMHPHHQARVGNKGSVSSEGSHSAASSTPGRSRLRQITRGDENLDDGSPAIPKFGDWDDNDPATGECYTEVFNKAREDKQSGGGKSTVITTEDGDFYGQRHENSKISLDVVGLVDEWAARFFEELDYINEGENGTYFAEMVKKDLPQVVIPKYTSRKVLTTQWVDGEKLSQSTENDVGELVNVGVICYLKQLLDTGFFHAYPHPGNMIRTPDGKLAILDYGLVTKLTDDQKYGMIEAIAHLIHRDYDAIVKDFVKLGFIPEGVNLDPLLPVLAKVFDQALEGGGAKTINFQELAADLAQITFDYRSAFLLILLLSLEQLECLEFAIVDEAYPYIAQRLLTDESPRLRSALCYTVFGKSGVFDAERFIDVMQAFESFITAAKSGGGENLNGDMAGLGVMQSQSNFTLPRFQSGGSQELPVQTRAALAFLLSDKGNFFREFLLDEIVKGIDAITREQLVQVMVVLGIQNATPVFSMVPSFGTIRPTCLIPYITEEDKVILNNVQKIVEFLTAQDSKPRSPDQGLDMNRVIQELIPVMPGLSAKVLPEVLSRLSLRVMARLIRDTFL